DETFNITPDPGYTIDQLTVDGVSIVPTTSYTFTHITTNHTIDVTFRPAATAVVPLPTDFALTHVWPNPAPNGMSVRFGLPKDAPVRLTIIDLQGRVVAVLADGYQTAGWHDVSWKGLTEHGPAAAGMYFVRYQVGGRRIMERFVLTR